MSGSSNIRGKKKAQWDAIMVKTFCEECVRQITAGQRQGKTLTRLAWKDVQVKFNHRAKRNYEHKQLKNKWDGLRTEWLAWKSIMSETGLGFNHEKGTVEASEEWWDAKIKMNRLYQNFKDVGLQNPTEMEIMFSTTVATGETAHTPAAGDLFLEEYLGGEREDFNEGSGDSDEPDVNPTENQSTRSNEKRKKVAVNSCTQGAAKRVIKGKSKTGTAQKVLGQIDRLCGVVETYTSTYTGPSYKNYDQAVNEVEGCLNILKDVPGVEVGDDIYMLGTRLFMEKIPRQMFRVLPNNEVRFTWLKQEFDREKGSKKH